MIVGLLAFVLYQGASTFWPGSVIKIETVDGRSLMGELTRSQDYRPEAGVFDAFPEELRDDMRSIVEQQGGAVRRRLIRTGNFDLTSEHFTWVSDYEIAENGESEPPWPLVVERLSWGRFYGVPSAFVIGEETVASDSAEIWALFQEHHPDVRARWHERRALEKDDIGKVNHAIEKERLRVREIEMEKGRESREWREAHEVLLSREDTLQREFERIRTEIEVLNTENARYKLVLTTAEGQEKSIQLDEIVRACRIAFEFLYGRPELTCEGEIFDRCMTAFKADGKIQSAVAAVAQDAAFCQ
jgi:phosphate transport system permease protein